MNRTSNPESRWHDLFAAYGADPARWPVAERAAFDALQVRDGDTTRDQAAQLDAWLDTLDPPAPDAGLRRRVLLAVAAEPRVASGLHGLMRELWRELGGARIAAPAFALAMAVGLGLGWATTPAVAFEPDDLMHLAQIEDTYAEYTP